jgi:Zn-dependent peptidase ImmA (M78 family)/transcriptional regulator with XRE-family HTH domain
MPTDTRTISLFDPGRLRLAREAAGMQKNELAAAIGITAAAVSQYELGQSNPSASVLGAVALRLGYPVGFFYKGRPGIAEPPTPHFRSLRSTSQKERNQAFAYAKLVREIALAVEERVSWPPLAIPSWPVDEATPTAEIENLVASLRQTWDVAAGPIGSVVRLLEAHGVIVSVLPRASNRIDAFSCQFEPRPVVMLANEKHDKARSRFDAAHELGHLVLHLDAEPGARIHEQQANAFAAELLMPKATVRSELPGRLDWDVLLVLKRRWGVSLRALIYRAHELAIMSDYTYARGMKTLAMQGRKEPGDLGQMELPVLFGRSLEAMGRVDEAVSEVAAAVQLPEAMVKDLMCQLDPRPLVLV